MRRRARTLGNYLRLRDDEPPFDASDALALGLLARENREHSTLGPFYLRAFESVCGALEFDSAKFRDAFECRTCFHDPRGVPLVHLARLRVALTNFCDEWGPFLEGDIWGQRLADSTDRASVAAAHAWFDEQRRGSALVGAELFDRALRRLLRWESERCVTFETLREQFAFPDGDEIVD